MAVTVKVGDTLTAAVVRRGKKDDGAWELLVVRDTNKKKSISVWATNAPTGVNENGQFIVTNIESVRYGAKKNGDKWYDDISVNAAVKPLADYGSTPASPGAFSPLDDDGPLPF